MHYLSTNCSGSLKSNVFEGGKSGGKGPVTLRIVLQKLKNDLLPFGWESLSRTPRSADSEHILLGENFMICNLRMMNNKSYTINQVMQ